MAQTLYNLSCFLIGGDTVFKVKIDPTDEVANLKNAIKEQNKVRLRGVEADYLILYMAEVDTHLYPTTAVRINKLNSLNLDGCQLLETEEPLSRYFGESSQSKRKYTIVKIPEGESIKTTVWYRHSDLIVSRWTLSWHGVPI